MSNDESFLWIEENFKVITFFEQPHQFCRNSFVWQPSKVTKPSNNFHQTFFMSTFSSVLTFVASQKQENRQTVLYRDYTADNKWVILVLASRNIVELYKGRKIHKATVHFKKFRNHFFLEKVSWFFYEWLRICLKRDENGREKVVDQKLFDEQIIDGKVGRRKAIENAVGEQILISLVEKKSFNSTENNFIVTETL